MSTVRSVDFLPEIFQTDANKQFLAATLDQLIQEPKFKKTEGFIGRRAGPGVNPRDRYVVEPTATRTNYQLEPGIVSLKPDTDRVRDIISYAGITDTVSFYGGNSKRPDLLYESDYYTWDPFIDFDKFVNFSQYFWVADGPDTVNVSSAQTLPQANFVVTRQSDFYQFSGVAGQNPIIELVRGGNYTFQVSQNRKQTISFRVGNSGTSAFVINFENNPTLTLIRGNTYTFNLTTSGAFPLWIKTQPTTGVRNAYNDGVSRNGASTGLITFTVPQDAPDVLYYVDQNQGLMQGVLSIVNSVPGSGPGFFIQTAPGVDGKLPQSPNISSRNVLGVVNNGTDLGVVTFNVPNRTEQNFYYDLPSIAPVDLVTELRFDQINNQSVDSFIRRFRGIDGITDLNGRTVVFANPSNQGWVRTTLFDPWSQGPANNGLVGTYDTTTYDQTTVIPESNRQQIWQISYINLNGEQVITLNKVLDVGQLTKFSIRYGTEYSSTQWFKNSVGLFEQIPLLSAAQDTLFYQDGADPNIFGRIKLIDPVESTTIFVDQIIGSKNYTSTNGVIFTNGLKVKFVGDVQPAKFRSGISEITYTQTESGSNYITSLDQPELDINQQIVFNAPTLGGLEAGKTYYVRSITTNGLKFTVAEEPFGPAVQLQPGTGNGTATTITNREYYVSGVGESIELLPVENFVVPETYVQDANPDTISVSPGELDYITISRAGKDRNAWSRSNRWFHIDVVNAAAAYNNTTVVLDNNLRAKRPIIEFRPGIRLWNMGTEGKQPIDIIDFETTDAFSNIEGTTGYSVDGYTFVEGTRVIFANDLDPDVRNKIYVVSFVSPNTIDEEFSQPIINLTLANDGLVDRDQSTVVISGTDAAGKTYWFNGINWTEAQQKIAIQQAPLFDVYDLNGISFGNTATYPSTTFAGSKLFGYAVGDTNLIDPVLQFPLQYLNINNVGDIVFENNLYKDSFSFIKENITTSLDISNGVAREYQSRTDFKKLLGWQNAAVTSQIYQQFQVEYLGDTVKIDIPAKSQSSILVPVVKIYVDGIFQDKSTYTVNVFEGQTFIVFNKEIPVGEIIEILILSDQVSNTGFYQVPDNFESNPLNANSKLFTLGTIRTHYQSICENLIDLRGSINGANNVRDLGNVVPFGLEILQQSAPLTLGGYFFRNQKFNIFESLTYNSQEYVKFKAKLLDAVTQQNIQFQTAGELLDETIASLNLGKIETQPFYWSDMIPSGVIFASNTYTVTFITTNVFDTVQVYNFNSANYLGLLVYKNDQLLTKDVDYQVAEDGPRITVLTSLAVGDRITVNEYNQTAGSFVPNTPTKLGLYPAWQPQITVRQSTNGLTEVLIGHDGSVTPLFGDIRDQVLLEFELRVFDNLKLADNTIPLTIEDVLPGQFRNTGFSSADINNIFAQDFLSYAGWNKLDYRTQNFRASNEFTWNYNTATNKLNNEPMPAAWRGIYRYFYDTQQPSLTPWEMLGLSTQPQWWNDRYGPAPYTRDNLVLWDDIEQGLVADPEKPYINPRAVRPGLTQLIPTGSEGELLSPYESVVGNIDEQQIRRSWSIGDGGPVEASWWNSSAYPFSVMRVLALTKPAKFFALFADRDLYRYDEEFDQFLYNGRFRLDATGIDVYGDGVSKASYINWIVDYNRTIGIDSTKELFDDLRNIDVRLCYKMASFSDKQYIKLFTEKSSPNSINTALMIPDESYELILYKNQQFDRLIYSSVAVQKTESGGFAVFGYSVQQPYFNALVGENTGRLQTYSAGGVSVQIPTVYSNKIVQVPYGFIFDSLTSVADFLIGYGKYLESQGLSFTDTANGYVLDWPRMVQEFLYWSQQGWDTEAIINLNPLAAGIQVTKPLSVVDSIVASTADSNVLDQNSRDFPVKNLNIVRIDNTFKLEPLNTQAVSFADLSFTNYEHMIVLDNQSVFGDLIYDPITGARQSRLKLVAVTTTDWNGTVNAPGFILNQDNVEEWTGLRTYSKGEIVRYKNVFWSALKIVQPSETFNFSDWTQSDYEQIELGLLPNIANKANQLANSYNINSANIESDNDLLSFGLIGFRPRQYMAALGLDDVSQVNIYRQFLDSKGTVISTGAFQGADLGKEAADYDVYENWAVLRATYGANANRSYVELRLDSEQLTSNPSLVQVVNLGQQSAADQSVLLGDVWRESYRLTSPDFLPTTTDNNFKNALPTAGYVNLNDADITVFDINDPESFDANFDDIKIGSTIWVAKINEFDWNIYRSIAVPGQLQHVCDNLNGTSRVIFSDQHNLVVGDKLIIKQFDPEINGTYTILSVPSLDTVNIAFQFVGNRTVANGTGLGLKLQTMRVAQASDVVKLPYTTDLKPGARVWVDDNGNGTWQVIEKQEIFESLNSFVPSGSPTEMQFGSAVAQTLDRELLFVGAPADRVGEGQVYAYLDNSTEITITSSDANVRGLGNAIAVKNNEWVAIGASESLGTGALPNVGRVLIVSRTDDFQSQQLLAPPVGELAQAGEFGHSVAISQDERWLYVGSPGVNRVHVYARNNGSFDFVDTIDAPAGTVSAARFGHTISCTTDGRQVVIGALNQTVPIDTDDGPVDRVQAGEVYVYDRNVQRFVYDNSIVDNEFDVLGTVTAPVQVYVNNERIIDTDFVVSGNTVTVDVELNIGDQVEIETNQFTLIQNIAQNQVEEFSNYGTAVDLCSNNCSLYVGAPQSSFQIFKGGVVERRINQSRTFGITKSLNTVADPLTEGHTIRINNHDVAVPVAPNNTLTKLAEEITKQVPNVHATVSNGRLTISIKNPAAADEFNLLQVLPGSVGNLFDVLGFETYTWTQTILSPFPVSYAAFGSSLSINTTATNLVVGSPLGTVYIEIDFDNATTVFDLDATVFFTSIPNSGAIYTYDLLQSANKSKDNPSKFAFGEQLSVAELEPYDGFGTAVSYVSGSLAAGAPLRLASETSIRQGEVFAFINPDQLPAWTVIQQQQPTVDIRLLNSVFLYDLVENTTTDFLDFINPLQGKILGAARQNIDYISAIDPAAYNIGSTNVRSNTWSNSQVGEIWWDTASVRFIDPNQDTITYASRRWAQTFPGSSIDIYQWVSSLVPPEAYQGPGTVKDITSYSVSSQLRADGVIVTEFYFWVRGITNILPQSQKTLPASVIASYIDNPRASGIPYIAPINGSTVALYNTGSLIDANDTVLHIEFDRIFTNDNVHVEYELIPENRADGFLSDTLYRKLQDSFCGVNENNDPVPDMTLSPPERYGVQFRPRQSMFLDRFDALKNYLTKVNNVLKQIPISESRSFNLLNSSEPQPTAASLQWDVQVANLEELRFSFEAPGGDQPGLRYLVDSDSENQGLWTIYQVTQTGTLTLIRTQSFSTADYWSYINWVRPGFNPSVGVLTKVRNFANLATLNLPIGTVVQVEANAQGKFEWYQFTDIGWQRVLLEDGTIEISEVLWNYSLRPDIIDPTSLATQPLTETRKIIQAINQELLIDELAIERNRALILVFNYVLNKFAAPEWLVKTSLIDVDHRIRDLFPYQNFIQDNQEFVEQYIQEVKPYHVQIREFNLQYDGNDEFAGDLTDFDIPAFFDTSLTVPQFVSPILLPYKASTAFNSDLTVNSDTLPDSETWETWPYSQWFNNYTLTVKNINMSNFGTGYTEAPEVIIVGNATVPATARAITNGNQVIRVEIITPGSGYLSTPTVIFEGGNGRGASAYAQLTGAGLADVYNDSTIGAARDYSLSRLITTKLKFDRYQYQSSVDIWEPNRTYQTGDLVRFDNRLWVAASSDSSNEVVNSVFNFAEWEIVDVAATTFEFDPVENYFVPIQRTTGIDRTKALYVSGLNSPGLDLPLLITGIEYPAPQVFGKMFDGIPSNPNSEFDGDAVYESEFTDTALGERFSDINVEGGEFVGLYEGHAPEELVNGSEFDTVNIRVFTRPGSDWTDRGHGFKVENVRYKYQPDVTIQYSWANILKNPVQVLVSNLTRKIELNLGFDFTIDWDDQFVQILRNVAPGEVFEIKVYDVGGGSQLYRENYIGADIGQTVIIPVNAAEINDIAVFVNGEISNETIIWQPYADSVPWNIIESFDARTVVLDNDNYYRALKTIIPGTSITDTEFWQPFVPTLNSIVDLGEDYGFDVGISLVALGFTTPIQYEWSTPQLQYVVPTVNIVNTRTVVLENSVIGTNPANLIVIRNGIRLRPPEGIEWLGDGSTMDFGLPQRGGYNLDIIDAAEDVNVWVNNILQIQDTELAVGDYFVTPADGSTERQVVFATAPAAGDQILISVSTIADYVVTDNLLLLRNVVNINDIYQIITWNDTSEQNILTQVFRGPIISGIVLQESFDSRDFDTGTINNESGSFDYTVGDAVATNNFFLTRSDVNPGRLWVTLNGNKLFEGIDYTVVSDELILSSGAIAPTDVVVITQITNTVVPDAIGFGIFQDMRGLQTTYRITDNSSTELLVDLSATADVINVLDASKLSDTNLEIGLFGVVTINGERITYRNRDLINNTVSGLRRGTAGTGAASHSAGSIVYDTGVGNRLFDEYQDRIVKDSMFGDQSTTEYVAESINNVDILAESLVRGQTYIITSIGPIGNQTDFTLVGAPNNNVGTKFTVPQSDPPGQPVWPDSQPPGLGTAFNIDVVEVYVGGIRQFSTDSGIESEYPWTLVDTQPVTVEFEDIVTDNLEITILVRQAKTWYQQGVDTASNGLPLQETDTLAARFLQGF
jgi:hypothetical protein